MPIPPLRIRGGQEELRVRIFLYMIPRISASLPVDGVSRCARYAFGPNRLHMCGPDANKEVLAYLHEGIVDGGLTYLLKKFNTLSPYLQTIAQANNIEDMFDTRVVEAYWLGNELLNTVDASVLYQHFTDNLRLKKQLTSNAFNTLTDKLSNHPAPHHNFHVMNVWRRTGRLGIEHTRESMDQCRISWGKVTKVDGPTLTVARRALVFSNGHPGLDPGSRKKQNSNKTRKQILSLGAPVEVSLIRRLEDNSLMEDVAVGNVISIHWGMPCEILSSKQLMNLKKYTIQSLTSANLSLP